VSNISSAQKSELFWLGSNFGFKKLFVSELCFSGMLRSLPRLLDPWRWDRQFVSKRR